MPTIDVTKEIRRAVDSGKVLYGVRESQKGLVEGKGEVLITCNGMLKLTKERIVAFANSAEVPIYEFGGNSLSLGTICGKPFGIQCMLVVDTGKSKIMDVFKKKKAS